MEQTLLILNSIGESVTKEEVTAADNLGRISNSYVVWLDILVSKKQVPLQQVLTKHASILLTIIMMEKIK